MFYSDSDIVGLQIEAATIEEFEAVMAEVLPELLIVNHLVAGELR